MKIPRLGQHFHIAWDFSLKSKKKFFPGGLRISISDFQYYLKGQKAKIGVSFLLINRYAMAPKIYLGKLHLFAPQKIASYLYRETIHPRFFAEALNLIATNAKELKPIIKKIQLKNLRRESIARALDKNKIQIDDLGYHFHLFSKKTVAQQLEILQKLGVLILKDGASLPADPKPKKEENPPFLRETRPRPPIRRVPASKISRQGPQLDLFSPET